MSPKEPKAAPGPAAMAVADNLEELRGRTSYEELAQRLQEIGRYMPEYSLRRIAARTRRVEADELAALAYVLEVAPVTLMMPRTYSADELVRVPFKDSATAEVTAQDYWNWLVAKAPLVSGGPPNRFLIRSRPPFTFGNQG